MKIGRLILFFIFIITIFIIFRKSYIQKSYFKSSYFGRLIASASPTPIPTSTPLPTPTITPTPTPRPLTFAEMNARYGPCASVPVLMYHHIQDLETAAKANATWLSVPPDTFRKQMEYLKNRGYNPISMAELANFFDSGTALPSKPVMITFDDGYDDNYTNAFPVLRELNMKATIFLPTGLMENYAYLTWNQVNEMRNSGQIGFANHTWSHHNVLTDQATLAKEIGLADTQLAEKGLNIPRVFSYPYGLASAQSKVYLSSQNYSMAFTTINGWAQCKQLRYELYRIRVGNTDLSAYGL